MINFECSNSCCSTGYPVWLPWEGSQPQGAGSAGQALPTGWQRQQSAGRGRSSGPTTGQKPRAFPETPAMRIGQERTEAEGFPQKRASSLKSIRCVAANPGHATEHRKGRAAQRQAQRYLPVLAGGFGEGRRVQGEHVHMRGCKRESPTEMAPLPCSCLSPK